MKYILVNIFLFVFISSQAQEFRGIWEGFFHTDITSSDKDHSYFVHLEVKPNGLLNGFYYNAPAEYTADEEVISEISDITDQNNLFNLVKTYQLYNKVDGDLPDLSFEFKDVHYLQSDTAEFLYGKWLPTLRTSSSEGANSVFWLRRVDSSYDSHHKKVPHIKVKIKPKAVVKKQVKTYEERKNNIAETFVSHEKEVNLEFYDNGVVDGDVISVYVNNQPVLTQRMLTVQPIKLTVPLEKNKETIITMFAETLGVFPPNTAVMILNSGYIRKTIFLSADFDSNVSVVIKQSDK